MALRGVQRPARGTVEAIRDLHSPSEDDAWPRCRGCDADGYESESPEWPCRTAELVYTEDEISDIKQALTWAHKWLRQMQNRNRSLGPRTGLSALLAEMTARHLDFALRDQPLYRALAASNDKKPGDTITFRKVSNIVNVSKHAMEDGP